MVQHVYVIKKKQTAVPFQARSGVQLFTDGFALENQVGLLDDPTSLLGSSTILNDDTFETPLTYLNCRYIGKQSTSALTQSNGGILTLPLDQGAEFRFQHDEDVDLDITNPIVGETHIATLHRVKDNNATPRAINWSNTQVGGVPATVRFSDNAEPTLTQTAEGYDSFTLYINGTNVIVGYSLNKGSDLTSSNTFLPNLVVRGTPITSQEAAGVFYDTVTTEVRAATVPIRVEGDAVVGAINVFGSSSDLVKSSGVNLIGNTLSPFNATTSINVNTSDTTYTKAIVAGTLEIDSALGRMPDFLHTEDGIALAFTNAPTAVGQKRNFQLLRINENTINTREINWDLTTVNGVVVPVVWEEKLQQTLTQEADAIDTILVSVYDEYVEVNLSSNWG